MLLLEVSTRRAPTWVRCDPESLIVIMDRGGHRPSVDHSHFGIVPGFSTSSQVQREELIPTSDVIPHKGKIGHSFVSTTELLAPKSEKKHLEADAALDYDLSL